MVNGEQTPVMQKTLELCDTLVEQPEFKAMRQHMDAFMSNEQAQQQYQQVVEKSQELQEKQQKAIPLTETEVAEFEKQRQELMNNPVAKGFLDAQQEMRLIQETVTRYVVKTFEVGHRPTADDMNSCGAGCSCGH